MGERFRYSYRAVAFLDVLGFENKLIDFEKEAFSYHENQPEDENDEENFIEKQEYEKVYYSKKANEFIDIFNSAISKLDKEKFRYFLFSDNICITVENINSNGEKSLIELLLIISELYYEFVQQGYFLRGGIDYGLFIDKSSIALGIPLVEAYKLESKHAVFPRILLSSNFIKQLEEYPSEGVHEFTSFLASSLVQRSCEIQYLNVFNHIFKVEDKENFFERYNHNICQNLRKSKHTENIFLKYRWLADEFNSFIESYTTKLAYMDENHEVTDEFINNVKQLTIQNGQ